MEFTKEQISEIMCKHSERENGLHDLLEIMLESMMVAERGEFLREMCDGNKGNGYRRQFGCCLGYCDYIARDLRACFELSI